MPTKINFERQPDAKDLGPHLRHAAAGGWPMVEKDCHSGQHAVICSTGTSIKDPAVISKVKRLAKKGHIVFGLKETIPYLREKGIKVKYSVSMDPGGDRQIDRTPLDQNVIYCLASSCHPKLYDHIHGAGCRIQVFHSACGHGEETYKPGIFTQAGANDFAIMPGVHTLKTLEGDHEFTPIVPLVKNELQLYEELFGNADTMCGGFTVTNRALALAKYMGFDKIYLAGTDFGWREEGKSHYSDLVSVKPIDGSYMTDHGKIDGTPWFTKPDQLASAVDIAQKQKSGEIKVLGDSLAAALSKHDDAFLDEIVKISTS
jgi:hypothetical protein